LENRPTYAVIDTEALAFNYSQIRGRLKDSTKVMAVVKANAYGHGDVDVSRTLERLGCEFFGVAVPEEGARLRGAGITRPLVVLGGLFPEQARDAFAYDLTPVVYDLKTALLIDEIALRKGSRKKIHIKVDTGMGRIGLTLDELPNFLSALKGLHAIEVEGVMSHFSEMDSPDKTFSELQLERFNTALALVRSAGFTPTVAHMANSAAVFESDDSHFDMVRPGIMLYGSHPAPHLGELVELKQVMQIRTRILHLKTLPPGSPISYGRTFVTRRESVIATLPIGYGDGLPRSLSGHGEAIIHGVKVPMVGLVCMDLVMCDVTDVKGVRTGDEAVIIGRAGNEKITAEEVAEKAGTISYEILCNISSRVKRIYV
jgi:alanine racemase